MTLPGGFDAMTPECTFEQIQLCAQQMQFGQHVIRSDVVGKQRKTGESVTRYCVRYCKDLNAITDAGQYSVSLTREAPRLDLKRN